MTLKPRLVLAGLGALGLMNVPTTSVAQSYEEANSRSLPRTGDVSVILDARDPSAAVEAYAVAIQRSPKDLDVENAFVRKMVEFGLPDLAESQARDIASRDPSNGLARAVVAFMNANHGRTPDALSEILVAVRLSPNEPFVLRTAGQILAWYDTQADPSDFSDDVRDSIEGMRSDLSGRAEFDDAYARARAAYIGDEAVEAPPPPAPTTTYVTTYVYADPYVRYWRPSTFYDPWWRDPWYRGSSTFVIVDRPHRHFRHHGFQRHDSIRRGDGIRSGGLDRDRRDGDWRRRQSVQSTQTAPRARETQQPRSVAPRTSTPEAAPPRTQPRRTDQQRTRPSRQRVETTRPRVETTQPRVEVQRPRVEVRQPRVEVQPPRVEVQQPRVEPQPPRVERPRQQGQRERPRNRPRRDRDHQ